MRLFIAFEPDSKTSQYLTMLQSEMALSGQGLRPATGHHITLRFLGELDEEKVPIIKKRLSCLRFKGFAANSAGIGFFPDNKNPRVIFIGIEPDDKLKRLKEMVDDRIRGLVARQDKRFCPHITLARVKKELGSDAINKIMQLKTDKHVFAVDSISLYKSTLTQSGPIYSKILTIPAEKG
ncbi:RNA 2',3'-cyclic phosphodiesterase [Candidatus Woesearchaeota archaeon]|nr:RNA 2',3'-cyclic phosphodiesterase [Candidatus Woesearchaeota archaeon]